MKEIIRIRFQLIPTVFRSCPSRRGVRWKIRNVILEKEWNVKLLKNYLKNSIIQANRNKPYINKRIINVDVETKCGEEVCLIDNFKCESLLSEDVIFYMNLWNKDETEMTNIFLGITKIWYSSFPHARI